MAGFAAGLAVAVIVWKSASTRIRVPLSGARELRVLQVSLGTNHSFAVEPIWKQTLRRALPRPWQNRLGSYQGDRFQTRHDSLVLYLSEYDAETGEALAASFDQPAAIFSDGFVARGEKRALQRNVVCLQFPCFARASRQVPLRVRHGQTPIIFNVPNPRPSHAANWQSQSLPQTNDCSHTRIILDGSRTKGGEFQARVTARALGDAPMGWTTWSLTAFDPWGNWSARDSSWHSGLASLPPCPTAKFLAEGREYISAGFVAHPTNGSCAALAPGLRARNLGVRFLMLIGPGSYQITNGLLAKASCEPGRASNYALLSSEKGPGTNWSLQITTPVPGLLLFSEPHNLEVSLSARLRERIGAKDGRIFRPSSGNRGKKDPVKGSKLLASFIGSRLPDSTTNLEVEIIASHRPAEFFVSATTF